MISLPKHDVFWFCTRPYFLSSQRLVPFSILPKLPQKWQVKGPFLKITYSPLYQMIQAFPQEILSSSLFPGADSLKPGLEPFYQIRVLHSSWHWPQCNVQCPQFVTTLTAYGWLHATALPGYSWLHVGYSNNSITLAKIHELFISSFPQLSCLQLYLLGGSFPKHQSA